MNLELSLPVSSEQELPWEALFALFETIALRYTKVESSSLPKELAEALLHSVCYTLGPALAAPPGGSLLPAYEAGVVRTAKKVRQTKRRWQVARLSLPKVVSLSARETLFSIGTFFENYDARFFAHAIPCDVDYQLCHPVPETLLGVDYVSEYLSRICIENDFLRLFPPERVDALLERACPDYRYRIDNLYAPIAANALALALLGEAAQGLCVTREMQHLLLAQFAPLTLQQQYAALRRAADMLCVALSITNPAAQKYLLATADALVPRIAAALATGSLAEVFYA